MIGKFHIYKITNNINGKIYIGQHFQKKESDNYFCSGKYINNSIRKHGKKNFTKEIIHDNIGCLSSANLYEKIYIKKYNSISPNGYNLQNGGKGLLPKRKTKGGNQTSFKKGDVPWNKGLKYESIPCSEEKKKNLYKKFKGREGTNTGKHFTQEHKDKIRESNKNTNKGRKLTQEHRNKIKESNKGGNKTSFKKGQIPWNKKIKI